VVINGFFPLHVLIKPDEGIKLCYARILFAKLFLRQSMGAEARGFPKLIHQIVKSNENYSVAMDIQLVQRFMLWSKGICVPSMRPRM
jgi:hypothetical protein